jgi:hypothetical protein
VTRPFAHRSWGQNRLAYVLEKSWIDVGDGWRDGHGNSKFSAYAIANDFDFSPLVHARQIDDAQENKLVSLYDDSSWEYSCVILIILMLLVHASSSRRLKRAAGLEIC